jgi:phosphonate transport system substrate-binding protein
MSEASQSSGNFEQTPPPARSGELLGALRVLLYAGLALAVAVVAYVAVRASQENAAMRAGQDRLTAQHGLIPLAQKKLASGYQDSQGRLIADPPSDPAQLVDPETLVIAHYDGDDDDGERVDWKALGEAITAATGRQVTMRPYVNSADEVADVRAAKIHLVALHAADVPYVVNNAGFVPVAVLGTAGAASGNHLVLAVHPKSKIKSLADVRGSRLTCTRPDSITGYRAAIAVLAQEEGMRPNVDYDVHFSLGQKRSIGGLLEAKHAIAALSADKLQEMVRAGEIKEGDYRVIYESQVIPRLTFGYSHKLEPELAAKITQALLAFDNSGAASDEGGSSPMRFIPMDYQKEFKFVRAIDSSFDPRFGEPVTASPAPEPQSVP